jgi:hypothetical protein
MVMKATLHYCSYHCDYTRECDSLAVAIRTAENGEEDMAMSAEKIVREDGQTYNIGEYLNGQDMWDSEEKRLWNDFYIEVAEDIKKSHKDVNWEGPFGLEDSLRLLKDIPNDEWITKDEVKKALKLLKRK